MNDVELRQRILEALCSVAPEVDPTTVDPNVRLRDQIDIDSMDLLNFVIAIHQSLGVDIPEEDYPDLTTINEVVAYISAHSAANLTATEPMDGR